MRWAPRPIELIHQNVHVDAVRDDLDEIVLDAELLEAVLGTPGSGQEGQGDRDQARAAAAQAHGQSALPQAVRAAGGAQGAARAGQLHSVEFLKQLLDLAERPGQAEKETPPEEDEDRGKAALTELFEEVRNAGHADHRRAHRGRDRRDRAPRALPRLAEHQRRRARGAQGPAQDAVRSTGCTRMRSCLRRRMGISGSIIERKPEREDEGGHELFFEERETQAGGVQADVTVLFGGGAG